MQWVGRWFVLMLVLVSFVISFGISRTVKFFYWVETLHVGERIIIDMLSIARILD